MNEQLPVEYTDCALDCLYCSLPGNGLTAVRSGWSSSESEM